MIVFYILVGIGLVACIVVFFWPHMRKRLVGDTPTSTGEFMNEDVSDDDLRVAVMEAMWPLPEVNPCMTTMADLPRIEAARAKCAKWKEWAATADIDTRTRKAYLRWVRYCEDKNDRAEEEARFGYQRKRHQEYLERERSKRERVAKITVPAPERL